jgi:hypothetical protein
VFRPQARAARQRGTVVLLGQPRSLSFVLTVALARVGVTLPNGAGVLLILARTHRNIGGSGCPRRCDRTDPRRSESSWLVRSRPVTSSCSRRLMIPAVASWIRPRLLLVSITVTPVGPIAMWAMFALLRLQIHPAVVQHDDVAASEPDRERPRGRCFSLGSVSPLLDMVRLARECGHDRSDRAGAGLDAAGAVAAGVLAAVAAGLGSRLPDRAGARQLRQPVTRLGTGLAVRVYPRQTMPTRPPRKILSFLSRSFTLLPGDLVLTRTPLCVGVFMDAPRSSRTATS